MISNIQKLRDKITAGQTCLGTGVTFTDPTVTEALADSVDFVWIDLEHNPIGVESLLSHLIAARAGGVPALVRVPGSEISFLKRVLDAGAEGIIVPQVRSAEEVRQLVSACRYEPRGNRGWGPRRPTNYGRRSQSEYVAEVDQRLFVVVQIENVEAVEELDGILAVDGLDSVAIGPNDLSGSMGMLGQVTHPEVEATIQTIIDKAHAAGLSVGIGMDADASYAAQVARMGVDWIQAGSDFSYMTGAADRLFAEVRRLLEA